MAGRVASPARAPRNGGKIRLPAPKNIEKSVRPMRQRSLRVKLFIVCCDEVSVCARVLSIARLTAADLFGAAFAEISNNTTGRMRPKSGKALKGAVSPQHEEEVPGSGMQRRKGGESGQKKSPCRLASAGTQESGVGNGTRTHDNRNHNPGLYQLSYSHQSFCFLKSVLFSRDLNCTGSFWFCKG